MSEGSSTYAGAFSRLSDFGSPPQGSPPQTRLEPAEARRYLEEGLEGVGRHQYYNPQKLCTAINREIKEFQFHGPAQYAVFSPVTDEEFTKIDKVRSRSHKGLRFLFLTNERTLVVKFMVGVAHKIALETFAELFMLKYSSMGLRRELVCLGGACFSSLASQKEADRAYKPKSRKYLTDLPTIVFECGVSESLKRLMVDAKWWLENSGERWELLSLLLFQWRKGVCMRRRGNWRTWLIRRMATRTGGCKIVGETVTGAPLKISFKKTMLRDPDEGLGEDDIVFDAEDFKEVAETVWAALEWT
ncbi:hypothetical protein B9Z19DRAFT_1095734 [Tuber borchii]|uniref:Uncharacterized protein n=1 Tax=Tuber borchii TaxID=42251 RepID=A0A2T6ZCB0_TUBBO|nr:hypothetical protein B9Z19DRAFT_1095734 [Tuber borchii]